MADQRSPLGPTGSTVAANVKRLRGDLSFAELSRRLTEIGRPIPPLGLRRIEAEARRVDADDLLALARALGVSPITLLMPDASEEGESISATAADSATAYTLWAWLIARSPIDLRITETRGGVEADGEQLREFDLRAIPRFMRDQRRDAHPAEAALNRAQHWVALALAPMTEPHIGGWSPERYRDWVVTNLRREIRTLEELAEDLQADRVVPRTPPWEARRGDG